MVELAKPNNSGNVIMLGFVPQHQPTVFNGVFFSLDIWYFYAFRNMRWNRSFILQSFARRSSLTQKRFYLFAKVMYKMSKLTHNRKFLANAISLTRQRTRKDDLQIFATIHEKVEELLIKNNFFDGLPFVWIMSSILYGLKDDKVPEYKGINKDYECLSLRIEMNCEGVLDMTVAEFTRKIEWVTYFILKDVCKTYQKDDTFVAEHFNHLFQ